MLTTSAPYYVIRPVLYRAGRMTPPAARAAAADAIKGAGLYRRRWRTADDAARALEAAGLPANVRAALHVVPQSDLML